ncbi:MAG: hypothetical protein AAGI44_10135 [Pseudomonadota bacterium]
MKSLTLLLLIAVFLLIPLGHVQAQEPPRAVFPSIVGNPGGADVEEAPELEGEIEDRDLGFGPEGPDVDIEGATTEEDIPEVGINGFERNGR